MVVGSEEVVDWVAVTGVVMVEAMAADTVEAVAAAVAAVEGLGFRV